MSALAAWVLSAGMSNRPHDVELSATRALSQHVGAQLEYIDEGKQPAPIANVNRALNLDAVAVLPFGRLAFTAKAGFTSSRLSHNGSGNGWENKTGFTGWNTGAGAGLQLTQRWGLHLELTRLRYQQSDKAAFEYYTFAHLAVTFTIP